MNGYDFSISRRLTLGFGAVLAVLLLTFAFIKREQRLSEAAQRELTDRILVRNEAATQLERSVLRLAITFRGYQLAPALVPLDSVRERADGAREDLKVLTELPKDADGDSLFALVRPAVDEYIASMESFLLPSRASAADAETTLTTARRAALEPLNAYVVLQQGKRQRAIASIGAARESVRRRLLLAILLAGVLAVAATIATIVAIRRPTRLLVGIADELRRGDWAKADAAMRHDPELFSRHDGDETRNEFRRIGTAFAAASVALEARERTLREQREEIQAQNEELQAQSEEIQAQNEELQAQAEEIQAQNEELQAQAEEMQSQNVELLLQAERLQEADAQKNDFLGLLAHELRNPLAAVSNCVHLLTQLEKPDPIVARARTVISRQTRQLTRLIDDLLDVTRIARGKMQLDAAPVELGSVLQDCVTDQRAALDQHKLRLDFVLPDAPLVVEGDRTRLVQIFGNVLENSIKFTDTGGHIAITAERVGDQVQVAIRDSGIGIDPVIIPRLFERFVQADPSSTRTAGGLGLGLSLVHTYVQLHGGSVLVESDGPGTGTRFTVTLPLLPEGTELGSATVTAAARADDGALRVLIVEDNPDAAETLREAVAMDGHEVHVARCATEGFELARAVRPDLVLCDIGLPRVDGYEFARRIRADTDVGGVFMVAVTGYATEEDRAQAANAGFNRHLTKPASITALRAIISESVAR
jgi:signal transduction histidine kinase/ActR/RegA family two-component response regulator